MHLGIEIGGTKLQLGVGDGTQPKFAELVRLDVVPEKGATGIQQQIAQAAKELQHRYGFKSVGIGFGGPIDSQAGTVVTSHQISGWDNFPFVNWLQAELNCPVTLANDCDCAAIAESRFGGGRGANSVFFITVGTGIGGGLALGGQLYGKGRPAIAEIGHLRIGLNEEETSDTAVLTEIPLGNDVESRASGQGIELAAQWKLRSKNDSPNLWELCSGDISKITAQIVAQAAASGDELSIRILSRAFDALGWGIAQMITLIAPEVVVIGGGVSLCGEDLFFEPVRTSVADYVFPPLLNSYKIVPAALGEEVVVHGAVVVAAMSHKA